MNTTLIAALIALAFSSTALAQSAYEIDAKTGRDHRTETSRDHSAKSTSAVDLGTLLSGGLRDVLPLENRAYRRMYLRGWTLEQVTDERVGGDLGAYRQARYEELMQSTAPAARWAAGYLATCTTDACVTAYADRETLGLTVQSAHMPQFPGFSENKIAGWRNIVAAEFADAWLPAVYYSSNLANQIEAALGGKMAKSPMSLAARRVALVRAFYSLPAAAFEQTWPERYTYTLVDGTGGSPIAVNVSDGHQYRADEKGLHILARGTALFGDGAAGGYKYSYTDDDTSSGKVSDSTSKGTTRTTKDTVLQGRERHVR